MKNYILAVTAILFLSSCKQENNETNLHITGNIKGLKQGKLYIQKQSDTSLIAIDSIIFKGNSSFEKHIKLDSPEMLYLFLDRGQTNSIDNNLPVFAEPGAINIETDNEAFFYRAKISGSENHKIYEDYLKFKKRYTDQNLDITEKTLRAIKKQDIKLLDSLEKVSETLTKRRYLFTVNFAVNTASHEVAPFLALTEIFDANLKYLDTIRKSMTPEVANSHYGKILTEIVNERKKSEK